MKEVSTAIVSAALAVLLASCGPVKSVGKATTELVSGKDEASPESVWNVERTWKQVGTNPPTYVPHSFEGTPDQSGEWLRDARDGKQLYIPAEGVPGLPASVLRAEAWKATRE